jgi:hypothetical protein
MFKILTAIVLHKKDLMLVAKRKREFALISREADRRYRAREEILGRNV